MVDFVNDNKNFTSLLTEFQIELSERQLEQFRQYYEVMLERNTVMNLTAITEYKEVIVKHFVDSLSLIKVIDIRQPMSIIDVGTGAGFPGIPLKIAFPNLEIVLLDSLNKRVGFLNEVIELLQLDGIKAIHGRAEEYGRDKSYRERFDLCVSRAVAKLASLSEYCLPYVKVGGHFIPYKAGMIEEELNQAKKAIHVLGGSFLKTESFTLPGSDIERTLLVIKKESKTSNTYPRNAGKPTKEPII